VIDAVKICFSVKDLPQVLVELHRRNHVMSEGFFDITRAQRPFSSLVRQPGQAFLRWRKKSRATAK